MNRSLPLLALVAGALLLGACDKKPNDPPSPQVQVGSTGTGGTPATQGAATDPSVPTATSTFDGASGPVAPAASGVRSNANSMSQTQESAGMPMAGQANDHSAPLPPKGASAPR